MALRDAHRVAGRGPVRARPQAGERGQAAGKPGETAGESGQTLGTRAALAAALSLLASAAAGAQSDRWYEAAGALALAAATDARVGAFARTHHDPALDETAEAVDPFGRAGVLVPALAAAVVVPRLAGRRRLADAALRVALTYAAADGVESVLKPLVGRHRPSDGRGPWRFHPLSGSEMWHSFPSAHTVHAVGLATGLALETRAPWVTWPAYGVAALVGLQRLYTGAHWGSDVAGSALLAVAVGRVTDGALRRRGLGHLLRPVAADTVAGADPNGPADRPRERRLQLRVTGRSVAVGWTF